jgi:hypothetical protein
MGICARCKMETSDATVTNCELNTAIQYPDGSVLQPVPYDPKKLPLPQWFRCPDCNIVPGGRHHANCDQEHCPKCGGQLISCECFEG